MNTMKYIAAAALLALAGFNTVDGAQAQDSRIFESLRTNSLGAKFNRNRVPLINLQCAQARNTPHIAGRLTQQCNARQRGTYYSVKTCRCEQFI